MISSRHEPIMANVLLVSQKIWRELNLTDLPQPALI